MDRLPRGSKSNILRDRVDISHPTHVPFHLKVTHLICMSCRNSKPKEQIRPDHVCTECYNEQEARIQAHAERVRREMPKDERQYLKKNNHNGHGFDRDGT